MKVTKFESELVRGWLHQPEAPLGTGLAITHGAGSNCESPLLRAVAEAFSSAGFHVLRFDLPYRQQRATGPPPAGAGARDREGLRRAAARMREITPGRVILGGHSYGGRQASMLAAESPEIAEMLLLLSYPLHPPRKPDQLRTAHWPDLRTPALFVHGTRDPFGSIEEMRGALPLIPASHRLFALEKAGHEMKPEAVPVILRETQCFVNELNK
jgi:predicted alpha/beta-hydrolase family hydrolase